MRSTYLAAGALSLLGLFAACGSDEHAPTAGDPTRGGSAGKSTGAEGGDDGSGTGGSKGGRGGNGGSLNRAGSGGKGAMQTPTGGAGGEGAEGGAPPEPVGAPPTVSIVSPAAPVTDPLGGKVLVADSMEATCKASQGKGADASAVDPATVKIAILDATGTSVISEQLATLEPNTDLYKADKLSLTSVANGKIVLRCTASSLTHAVGTATLNLLADRGPKITITAPAKDAKLALKKPATFTFTALPVPVTPTGDTQADVKSVKLTINGVEVPTTPIAPPGTYEAKDINLNGPLFTTKPNGVTDIAITATDKRAPDAATSTNTSTVYVDGEGPLVSLTSPSNAEIVGGVVTVTFTASDPSGIEDTASSISVTVDSEKHGYNDEPINWTHVAGTASYSFKFDSRRFSTVQIPIGITATDTVGNSTTLANTAVYLDNVGPKVDLDPLPVRVQDLNSKNCSASFDPVGDYNANDLQSGVGYDWFRAMVWEQTNQVAGSTALLHYKGTDQSSVKLFFRRPADKPLLINSKTPGSGICDEIGDTGNAGEVVNLTALPAWGGNPLYNGNQTDFPAVPKCTVPSQPPPDKMCSTASEMWQVIGHSESNLSEPAIFAYAKGPGISCNGEAWSYSALAQKMEGWVCLAARAEDGLRNVGVSPPLRVCFDDPETPEHPACLDGKNAPTCTDGCTPPPRGGGFVISRIP